MLQCLFFLCSLLTLLRTPVLRQLSVPGLGTQGISASPLCSPLQERHFPSSPHPLLSRWRRRDTSALPGSLGQSDTREAGNGLVHVLTSSSHSEAMARPGHGRWHWGKPTMRIQQSNFCMAQTARSPGQAQAGPATGEERLGRVQSLLLALVVSHRHMAPLLLAPASAHGGGSGAISGEQDDKPGLPSTSPQGLGPRQTRGGGHQFLQLDLRRVPLWHCGRCWPERPHGAGPEPASARVTHQAPRGQHVVLLGSATFSAHVSPCPPRGQTLKLHKPPGSHQQALDGNFRASRKTGARAACSWAELSRLHVDPAQERKGSLGLLQAHEKTETT